MRLTNYLPQPSLLVSCIVPLALFAALPVAAQNQNGNQNQNDQSSSSAAQTTTTTPAQNAKQTSSTTSPPPSSTSSTSQPPKTSSTTGVSISNSASPSSMSVPKITISNTGATSVGEPATLPTLVGSSVPKPSVPPTANAPFMKQSHLPDGTVFIAVGSVLGAMAIAILLWRAIVSLLLSRSVKRAALAQGDINGKSGFPGPPAPFYKYTDHASALSLGTTTPAGRGVRRTTRGPIPSSNPSQSNLFFSPTAAGSNGPGNRSSAFLPSGFYAAGTPSPGPSHEHSISLTNLRPDSRGHPLGPSRSPMGPSPPGSPHMSARRDMSTSSLNLSLAPGQRAPSAYLDDLLADDPSAFPPSMPAAGGPRAASHGSGSQQSRL